MVHKAIAEVTERIAARSRDSRARYLKHMDEATQHGVTRAHLGCSNLAHGFAACGPSDKQDLAGSAKKNFAIVSAYNDMLSAHQPYERFPTIIKHAAHAVGAVAQFAGGVPAMCDGVTQGQPGMELSLFSRDVIAMATAVALSHNMFDGALMLGICDKIVPGLLMGAAAFGHLPVVFVPGGPMPSGIPNKEKARVREDFAAGKIGQDKLLEAEAASYHAPGTCTFYGTANTNQMMVELMGLQLPGSSFVNPGDKLRDALTRAAVTHLAARASEGVRFCDMLDERAVVNGVVGLCATGGSTNHTLHIVAVARAAGIRIDWSDFADISAVVPLLTRIYPNGDADVNAFQQAGGMAVLARQLLEKDLLHENVRTVFGTGLEGYTQAPRLDGGEAAWGEGPRASGDTSVLADIASPFDSHGGLRLMQGNLGRAIFKTSAVRPEHRVVEAPARVFTSQQALQEAFKRGELGGDFVAVLAWQGPAAIGMPELHKLTPPLSVLQGLGQKVALLTDGRMSGASGRIPAAIHVTPECAHGGPLAKVRDGDIILVDGERGIIEAKVDAAEWAKRTPSAPDLSAHHSGSGRELFAHARAGVSPAEEGASFLLGGKP
ncbi:MAG: phosphogluconate dehydratase [Alphaproteobacteria bacterium]